MQKYPAFGRQLGGQPGTGVITIAQVDQPNTPNANFIAGIDAFTLAPDQWASNCQSSSECPCCLPARHSQAAEPRR
jgi:hypothetical protein